MINTLLSLGGLTFVFRWLHLFFGILWIGILYYLNYVQGAFMAETKDASTKSQVTQLLVPRVMWWFRWGAMWTFVTGLLMLMVNSHIAVNQGGMEALRTPLWINILTGALFGTFMWANVWFVIWPRQKKIIANAVAVAGGAAANPEIATIAARSGVASRTNVLFSIPMMFFMLAANHLQFAMTETSNVMVYWLLAILIILGLEANALYGKTGPITTIKGVITCGFALAGVFVVLLSVLM